MKIEKAIYTVEPDRPLYSVPKYRLFSLEIEYSFDSLLIFSERWNHLIGTAQQFLRPDA
jgi:hypothetical protein